jgi:uncharacterized protein
MYLVGAEHPNKDRARRLLEDAVVRSERLVTDVEAFQEILHRYVAIDRRDAIQPAFDALHGIVDEVLPIVLQDAERAKQIVLGSHGLSGRDALHVAVMERERIPAIMSFDAGFDRYPAVTRLA